MLSCITLDSGSEGGLPASPATPAHVDACPRSRILARFALLYRSTSNALSRSDDLRFELLVGEAAEVVVMPDRPAFLAGDFLTLGRIEAEESRTPILDAQPHLQQARKLLRRD